VSERKNTI